MRRNAQQTAAAHHELTLVGNADSACPQRTTGWLACLPVALVILALSPSASATPQSLGQCMLAGVDIPAMAVRLPKCLALPLALRVVPASWGLRATHDRVVSECLRKGVDPVGWHLRTAYCVTEPVRRFLITEKMAEETVRKSLVEKGWTPIFDGRQKGLPQGPDQSWRMPDGSPAGVEVKGGSSRLKSGYGAAQATPLWFVRSSKRTLRSPSAKPEQKAGAKLLLEAAAEGKLRVFVARVTHSMGLDRQMTLTPTSNGPLSSDVCKEASLPLRDYAMTASETGKPVEVLASTTAKAVRLAKGARMLAKVAGPAALAVTAAASVTEIAATERAFASGEIDQTARESQLVGTTSGLAGMAVGCWAGGKAGAALGSPGGPWGIAIGSAAGGLGGCFVGGEVVEDVAEHALAEVHGRVGTLLELGEYCLDGAATALNSVGETAGATFGLAGGLALDAWDASAETADCMWEGIADGLHGILN